MVKTMVELRDHERATLSAVKKLSGKALLEDIADRSGLSGSAVMRAVMTLQEKLLVTVYEKKRTTLKLNDEGKLHAKKGLPERRLLCALEELGGDAARDAVFNAACLEKQFVPIALGWAQKKKWTILDSETGRLRATGKQKKGSDERLLEVLGEKGQIAVEDLDSTLQEAVQVLKGRKFLVVEEKVKRDIELTDAGLAALKKKAKAVAEVTQLTQELIVSGKWRKVKLQRYNIEAPVAKTWSGKKHPYVQFLDEVKAKLVNLGFREMVGTSVETSFFNFDALYTPQDHPAREIFDVYFVKEPQCGDVNVEKHVLENVKRTHENGWKTGSTGWRYKYSVKEARRLILRGHGTCLSARTLLSKNLEIPGRYFSIARCYRPEVLDKTHLTEFNQVEGIVVDEKLTLRDLLGILKTFATEIAGAEKFRLKPDYYPFTEPSVELSAYTEGCGWIEFGGSGIFRPEVTLPLGIEVPVIAWGLGIDRLFMVKAGVDDIRYLFAQDLDWLRRKEMV